jgi:hypothetical protein
MIWYDNYILMIIEQSNTDMLTTIKLDSKTRDLLADLGKKNESYDTILLRLITHFKENPPKKD